MASNEEKPVVRPVEFCFGSDEHDVMWYGVRDATGRMLFQVSGQNVASDFLTLSALINLAPAYCRTCGSTEPTKRNKRGGEIRTNKPFHAIQMSDLPDCDDDVFHLAVRS